MTTSAAKESSPIGGPRFATTVDQLALLIEAGGYDALTFDLFDTLLFRDCLDPEHVFHAQAELAATAGPDIPGDWVARRRAAEGRLVRASRDGETTLTEIYAELAVDCGLDPVAADRMMALELAAEQRSWRANLPLIALVQKLQADGIALAVYSDTYLPYDVLRNWLDAYLPEVTLYCSSQTRRTKRSGAAFRFLRRQFAGRRLAHVGDHLRSDGTIPERYGIPAIVFGGRGRFSSSMPPPIAQLARLRGIERYPDWLADRLEAGLGVVTAQWAFGWSLFLISFLESLRVYVGEHGIGTVWFTSRDCESIYACLAATGRLSEFPGARYVHTSRRAISDPPFDDEVGDPATRSADWRDYFRAVIERRTADESPERILLVDVGWKGSLQRALAAELGTLAEIHGFYVSLEPESEAALGDRAFRIIPWDTGTFNRAMTEIMFGFLGQSCIGYDRRHDESIEPRFGGPETDHSDALYTMVLRDCLSHLLASNWQPERLANDPAILQACAGMMRRLHLFPRRHEVTELQTWSIGSDVGGGNASLLNGADASIWSILTLRMYSNNIWPNGALAHRIGNRYLAYALQLFGAHARSFTSRRQRERFLREDVGAQEARVRA